MTINELIKNNTPVRVLRNYDAIECVERFILRETWFWCDTHKVGYPSAYDVLPLDLEVHVYAHYSYDDRRIWELGAVYYKEGLVGIYQKGGREGDDFSKLHVTNFNLIDDINIQVRQTLIKKGYYNKYEVSVDDEFLVDKFYHDTYDRVKRIKEVVDNGRYVSINILEQYDKLLGPDTKVLAFVDDEYYYLPYTHRIIKRDTKKIIIVKELNYEKGKSDHGYHVGH